MESRGRSPKSRGWTRLRSSWSATCPHPARRRAGCCVTKAGRRKKWSYRPWLPAPFSRPLKSRSNSRSRNRTHTEMNVGIDLGTTNSALAFIDPKEAAEADYPTIQVLDVPQYVAQGRIEPRRTLPSFLHLSDQEYVGVYAREQGALVPTKNVHSAKSWLSNPEVDRTAKILPWDAQEGGRVLSPVEVSTRIIEHLAKAWKEREGTPISEKDEGLTVPASFDDKAREMTVAAARAAGTGQNSILGEPPAAFDAW